MVALLIAVFAVGCTFTGTEKDGLKQLSKITEESIVLVAMNYGLHGFALPKEKYGELVELLHEVAEKQVIKEELVPIAAESPDEVEYCMTVISGENVWVIGCVKNGQSGANVFLEASNMTTTAGEAHLYWVRFEELCCFVTEALDAYMEEGTE